MTLIFDHNINRSTRRLAYRSRGFAKEDSYEDSKNQSNSDHYLNSVYKGSTRIDSY
jgi:hypothetical protein